MSGTPSFKLSNVIGAPFKDYVQEQLKTRVLRGMQLQRTPNELIYLANKTAWVKLSSSVNLSGSYVNKLNEYYRDEDGFNKNNVEDYNLAKNWILQGGTSKQSAGLTNPLEESVTLRSGLGFDGAYGLGGVQAQGYRPMPGLESVVVESAGKLGSLRYANITFKVWSMNQLDVIDTLYFRLGYTMLLEWGHVHYFENSTSPGQDLNNDGIVDSTVPGILQTSSGGVDGFFKKRGVVKKEEVLKEVNARIIETDGNYDAMLGVVTNFNYSFNQEGGWDCTLKLLGLGSIIETQKINSTYDMPPWSQTVWDKYVQVVRENIRKKKQAELDKLYRLQLEAAKSENDKLVNNYNQSQPLKNLRDYYNTLGYPVFLDEEALRARVDVKQALWRNIALTPFTFENFDPDDNLTDRQLISVTAIEGQYTQASGYIYNNSLYATHLRETTVPNLTPSQAGWRYPVQAGAVYEINYSLLGRLIAVGRYRYYKENFFPLVTEAQANNALSIGDKLEKGKEGLAQMLIDFYNRDEGKANRVTFDGELGPYAFAPSLKRSNGSQQVISSAEYEVMKIETPPIDIQVEYGTSTNYVKQVVSDSNAFNTTVSFELRPSSAQDANIIDDNYRIIDSPSELDSQIRLAIGSSLPNKWTVEEVTTESNYFEGNRTVNPATTLTFNNPGRAKVKLRSAEVVFRVKVASADAYYDTGKVPVADKEVSISLAVVIETYVYSILDSLIGLPSSTTLPPGTPEEVTRQIAEVTDVEEQQIKKVGGLGSALEAMLSIIQYGGVVDAIEGTARSGQLTSFDIAPNVSDFIRKIDNSPLREIFDGDGNLKTNEALEREIQQASASDLLTDPYYLGIKGFNTELMSYNKGKAQGVSDIDFYKKYPLVDFKSLFTAYVLYKEFYTSGTDVQSSLAVLETPVYIKLGFLFFFINNLCLLYDSTKKGVKGSARPHFYIDYNPSTNLCLTTPAHLSINPTTCLIPYKGTTNDYQDLFKAVNNKLPNQPGLDTETTVTSNLIPAFKGVNDYQGRTMEILVNTQYLLDTIKQSVDRDNHNDVYFRPFIDRVLADLNKATGDINAFRLGYIDAGNVAAVLDDQYVPPHADDPKDNVVGTSNRGNALLPLFGLTSLARELTIETNISTKMSSMIAIAARGDNPTSRNYGSTQSTDASNLYWLSDGLFDRVVEQADDISKQKSESQQSTQKDKKDNAQAVSDLFNEHVKSIYTGNSFRINRSAIEPSNNFYIQALTKTKALDQVTRGTPIIPVNVSFATDGIAGINMGNVFLVPNDKLPISLRGEGDSYKFGFMVMGLKHTIANNQWITNVRGQIIKLRPEENAKLLTTRPALRGAAPSSSSNQATPARINKRIFLSAGHGGADSGAAGSGYIERDLTLEQRRLIREELLLLGVPSSDILIDPDQNSSGQTGQYAIKQGWNSPNVLLCDLHFNAGGGRGTTVYIPDYDPTTNRGSGSPRDLEISLAADLVAGIGRASGLSTRGGGTRIVSRTPQKTPVGVSTELDTYWVSVRRNPYLPLLYAMKDASTVLIETCFIDDANDMRIYQSNKQAIAKAIAETLLKYAQQ